MEAAVIIGIVGMGIVGSAAAAGFRRCGYDVIGYDKRIDGSSLADLLPAEIVYVCVPTPEHGDGCDTSIVESVVNGLMELSYDGIVAIKSTVTPGTTRRLIDRHGDRVVVVPEFLKERSAEYDFIFNHRLLLVGTDNINHYHTVLRSHGDLPKSVMRVTPTEAEAAKYYHNTFNAMRVVFANVHYEICRKLDIDYRMVKLAFLANNGIPDEYLDVSDQLRGYGGACLPKDVRAMSHLCKQLGLPYGMFEWIDRDNSMLIPTVFDGMRK